MKKATEKKVVRIFSIVMAILMLLGVGWTAASGLLGGYASLIPSTGFTAQAENR